MMTNDRATTERLTLNPEEAAQLIGVSMPTMYALCKRKDFPAVRFGRSIRIPKASFEQWLDRQAREGGGD